MHYSTNNTITMGISTVNHRVRISLKLNCLEYCVADFFDNNLTGKYQICDFIGINNIQLQQILDALVSKNVLILNSEQIYLLSDKWRSYFDTKDSLEDIWALHKQGSKQECKTRLPKVLKQIDIDSLKTKLKDYIKACEETDLFPKNLCTWLNPTKKHWDDPLPKKRSKFMATTTKEIKTKFIIR